MTLSRTEEIRQVASEWEFDKRIHAPAYSGCSSGRGYGDIYAYGDDRRHDDSGDSYSYGDGRGDGDGVGGISYG